MIVEFRFPINIHVQPVCNLTVSAVHFFVIFRTSGTVFSFFILLMNSTNDRHDEENSLSTAAPSMGIMSHPEEEE
jgi:hypothetical protein